MDSNGFNIVKWIKCDQTATVRFDELEGKAAFCCVKSARRVRGLSQSETQAEDSIQKMKEKALKVRPPVFLHRDSPTALDWGVTLRQILSFFSLLRGQ